MSAQRPMSATRMRQSFQPTDATSRRLAGNYRPFCGFNCWSDYVATVVAPDVGRDEPTCPTCGAES